MNSNFDIIVASEWMKKRVVLSPIYSGKKIHLIPFGINQEIFKKVEQNVVRKKLGIPNNAFVIFFRYNDEYSPKGSNYIDYALSKIKTNKKVYVISVDKKVIKRRKDFVYKEFGWITDDYLLADLYCASDLFLMPSIEESFGMMAAEAMSCGLLPIVLDDTALPEIVNSPTCGVSIKRDEKEYAKNVQYYIDNDNERIKKAKNCYIFAKSKYNKDVYIEKIIKLYREVMKNHHQDDETKNLLNQLKKYMMVDSYIEVSSNLKRESIWWRRMLVVIFYKIDKIFPKNIRKLAKNILIKIDFMKEYFIK